VVAIAIAAALGSCDAPPPEPSREPVARGAEGPSDLATPRSKKGAVIGGETVARAIAWPSSNEIDTVTRDALDGRSRAALDRAALPVLVPPDAAGRGTLVVGESWFSFATRGDAYTVNVSGSARARLHHHVRRADPTHEIRGEGGFIGLNEGIWSLSWIENGAAYSLDLECDDPRADACADPNEALRIAQSLVYVGGEAK
jgi:hypothetical protein